MLVIFYLGKIMKKNKRQTKHFALILALIIFMLSFVPAFAEHEDSKTTLEAALSYIHTFVQKPSYGVVGGEWAAFDMARGGIEDSAWFDIYLTSIKDAVANVGGVLHAKKYTEYSRVIMALTSMGIDSCKIETSKGTFDLVAHLLDKQDNGEYWPSWQGNNGSAFALIALDCGNYYKTAEGNAARAFYIDSLVGDQRENGGWGLDVSLDYSDIDMTAMIVQALAPYYKDAERLKAVGAKTSQEQIGNAINKALDFFAANSANSFTNVEACSQVIAALSCLGRDAANDEKLGDVLSLLYTYYLGDGQFAHEIVFDGSDKRVSEMATEQACYALIAYNNFKTGKNSLYDMTDVFNAQTTSAEKAPDEIWAQTHVGDDLVPNTDGKADDLDAERETQKKPNGVLQTIFWAIVLFAVIMLLMVFKFKQSEKRYNQNENNK